MKTKKHNSTKSENNTWTNEKFCRNKEIILKKNYVDILRLKNTMDEIKNAMDNINSTMDREKELMK